MSKAKKTNTARNRRDGINNANSPKTPATA